MLMHALAASCEELRARTGNPPLGLAFNPVVFFSRRLALADKLTVYTSRSRRPSQSRSLFNIFAHINGPNVNVDIYILI